MSQKEKNNVISMKSRGKRKKSTNERKRLERSRRKIAGQAAITVHVDEKHCHAVRTFEAILNAGDVLSKRLLNFLEILNYKMPDRKRARLRLPRFSPADARAACANLIRFKKVG